MNYLPKLSEIKKLDDILFYTMSQKVEYLMKVCNHYGIASPKCGHCGAMCPQTVAEAVYAKAVKEATNAN